MIISMIAAMAQDRVIGLNNHMPWHMPADLQHFKALTLGKPVVMGRYTCLSLEKPLPKRRNIVLTHDKQFMMDGFEIAHEWQQVKTMCADCEEVMIVGGEAVYRELLPFASRLYLTEINASIKGDRFFPEFDKSKWKLITEKEFAADDKNPYPYRFLEYRRAYE